MPSSFKLELIISQPKKQSPLCRFIGYLSLYHLTAFAIVAFLRNTLHSEQYASYAGFAHESWAQQFYDNCFVSLIGLPPFAVFAGKLQIFAEAANAIQTAPVGFKSLLITMLSCRCFEYRD